MQGERLGPGEAGLRRGQVGERLSQRDACLGKGWAEEMLSQRYAGAGRGCFLVTNNIRANE